MGRALIFDTTVDVAVRQSGETRKKFAVGAHVSVYTLRKARGLDRGNLHWTSLVLIGIKMGRFRYGEVVREDDPRLRALAPGHVTARGSAARQWKIYGT